MGPAPGVAQQLPNPETKKPKSKEKSVAQSIPVAKKPISPSLQAGDEIRTQEGRELKIAKYADQGKRGVVFQAQDFQGKTYALKVAKDQLPEIWHPSRTRP